MTMTTANFICNGCQVVKCSCEELEIHVKLDHLNWEPYKCTICDCRRATKRQIRDHMRSTHHRLQPGFWCQYNDNETLEARLELLMHQQELQLEQQQQQLMVRRAGSRPRQTSDAVSINNSPGYSGGLCHNNGNNSASALESASALQHAFEQNILSFNDRIRSRSIAHIDSMKLEGGIEVINVPVSSPDQQNHQQHQQQQQQQQQQQRSRKRKLSGMRRNLKPTSNSIDPPVVAKPEIEKSNNKNNTNQQSCSLGDGSPMTMVDSDDASSFGGGQSSWTATATAGVNVIQNDVNEDDPITGYLNCGGSGVGDCDAGVGRRGPYSSSSGIRVTRPVKNYVIDAKAMKSPLTCAVCSKIISNLHERHALTHFGMRCFQCPVCGVEEQTLHSTRVHIVKRHPETADTDVIDKRSIFAGEIAAQMKMCYPDHVSLMDDLVS